LRFLAAAFVLALTAACGESKSGPIAVSAIDSSPQLVNPNLIPLDAGSAFLAEALAQGLVRFDANGEIEPALAQSWIVSDDGRRYTFRIRRIEWAGAGARVTAEQVASRLRAAISRASRNRLKPALGAIQDVVAMTDEVLEISLVGPRPNLLQLLAQPELAIILNRRGTGPYQLESASEGLVRLTLPRRDEEEADPATPDLLLRGESAAMAVARFADDRSDLVLGGTIGDLALARAAGLPGNRLSFDPGRGLFGLVFTSTEGVAGDAAIRRALSMAIDRQGLIEALGAPGLEPGLSLVPPGTEELPRPARPDWASASLPMRREAAARAVAALEGDPPRLRVAMPDGPGYRILFAHLRRDWRRIGVETVRVAPGAAADLRLIDEVAPAVLAAWYLRHFTCEASRICNPDADAALQAARSAPTLAERQLELRKADMVMTALTPYIPLTAPVRWSLVSRRLTGFRPNMFDRHPANTLIAEEN
jgi:peptide/nickel transport system substrate-binding protein